MADFTGLFEKNTGLKQPSTSPLHMLFQDSALSGILPFGGLSGSKNRDRASDDDMTEIFFVWLQLMKVSDVVI